MIDRNALRFCDKWREMGFPQRVREQSGQGNVPGFMCEQQVLTGRAFLLPGEIAVHLRDENALFVLNLLKIRDLLPLEQEQRYPDGKKRRQARKREVSKQAKPACLSVLRGCVLAGRPKYFRGVVFHVSSIMWRLASGQCIFQASCRMVRCGVASHAVLAVIPSE
ncbi:MAG: hypothetical protein JJE42_05115 [Burkholderiales bacterium]|nr:hypothetical protein [Burkholderiales bacterium]